MILMGDEVRRHTQGGNNNAYCHDNEIELVRVGPYSGKTPAYTGLSRSWPRDDPCDLVEAEQHRLSLNQVSLSGRFNKAWHGLELGKQDWSPEFPLPGLHLGIA